MNTRNPKSEELKEPVKIKRQPLSTTCNPHCPIATAPIATTKELDEMEKHISFD